MRKERKETVMSELSERYDSIEEEYMEGREDRDTKGSAYADAVSCLPPADRKMIISYAETASYRTIGEIYGITAADARHRIAKIRQKIRRIHDDNA